MAPPKNGNRFTVPTEVPAISTGKSSLVVVNPIATMDEAQIEKTKNRMYKAAWGRPEGNILKNNSTKTRPDVQNTKTFFRLFKILSDKNPKIGLPTIIPHAIMLRTAPASALVMP